MIYRRVGLALAGLLLGVGVQAGSLAARFCDSDGQHLSTADQDRLLSFAAVVRQVLASSSEPVALISRSGLRLQRWGVRYSHAGLALAGHPDGPWHVRQLYYACNEGQSRVFDQGVSGFLFGTESAKRGFVSLLFVSGQPGEQLQRSALDREQALSVLESQYNAIAHPFSVRDQNCNQWVAELMALAWGGPWEGSARASAQAWLAQQGYQPSTVQLGSQAWLWLARAFLPFVSFDGHPAEDWRQAQVRTTLPVALEQWLHSRPINSRRVELCHTETQVVIRDNGADLSDRCEAQDGDRVVPL